VHDLDVTGEAGEHFFGQFRVLRPDHQHQHADAGDVPEGVQGPGHDPPPGERQVHLVQLRADAGARATGQHHRGRRRLHEPRDYRQPRTR
jgi:hypothetical protein